TRALQRAVHRGDRGVEAVGDLRRGPAEDLCEEQHGALLRGKVLKRRYEREMDALPEDDELGGVGVRGERVRIGHRLEPVWARHGGERIVGRTGWAGLRRARSPRPLSEQIEAHV